MVTQNQHYAYMCVIHPPLLQSRRAAFGILVSLGIYDKAFDSSLLISLEINSSLSPAPRIVFHTARSVNTRWLFGKQPQTECSVNCKYTVNLSKSYAFPTQSHQQEPRPPPKTTVHVHSYSSYYGKNRELGRGNSPQSNVVP